MHGVSYLSLRRLTQKLTTTGLVESYTPTLRRDVHPREPIDHRLSHVKLTIK